MNYCAGFPAYTSLAGLFSLEIRQKFVEILIRAILKAKMQVIFVWWRYAFEDLVLSMEKKLGAS